VSGSIPTTTTRVGAALMEEGIGEGDTWLGSPAAASSAAGAATPGLADRAEGAGAAVALKDSCWEGSSLRRCCAPCCGAVPLLLLLVLVVLRRSAGMLLFGVAAVVE